MKRFLLRAIMWLGLLFAPSILLIVAFYLEEDWRCGHEWEEYQQTLQARGEILDLKQLAPNGKPEDDLSKNPLFAGFYAKKDGEKPLVSEIDIHLKVSDSTQWPKPSQYLKGKPLDLASWQNYYRALPEAGLASSSNKPTVDVLKVLSRFDFRMDQLDKAVSNPDAFFPTQYVLSFGTPLGGVTSMIRVAQLLQLRAIAHLENNETDLAEKDYLLSFRINQPLTKNCFVVNYLVVNAVRSIDDAVLWEGIHRHAWTDPQLREMEAALSNEEMLPLAVKALRTERASEIEVMKFVQNDRYDLVTGMANNEDEKEDVKSLWAEFEIRTFLKYRPSGWGIRELTFLSRQRQQEIDTIDLKQGTLDPNYYNNWKDPKTYNLWFQINHILPLIMSGPIEKLGNHVAKSETYRRLARLACRLEEYRIANKQYPEKLGELPDLPEHLNQEVLSEEPLHYQRKGDEYLLYSVGWNQKDDGGVIAKDEKDGDWVWPSP